MKNYEKTYELKVKVTCSWADDSIKSHRIEAADFNMAYHKALDICCFNYSPDYKVDIISLVEEDN